MRVKRYKGRCRKSERETENATKTKRDAIKMINCMNKSNNIHSRIFTDRGKTCKEER